MAIVLQYLLKVQFLIQSNFYINVLSVFQGITGSLLTCVSVHPNVLPGSGTCGWNWLKRCSDPLNVTVKRQR